MDLVNIRRIFGLIIRRINSQIMMRKITEGVLCMVMEKSSKGVVNVKINNNKSNARVKNVEMEKSK